MNKLDATFYTFLNFNPTYTVHYFKEMECVTVVVNYVISTNVNSKATKNISGNQKMKCKECITEGDERNKYIICAKMLVRNKITS